MNRKIYVLLMMFYFLNKVKTIFDVNNFSMLYHLLVCLSFSICKTNKGSCKLILNKNHPLPY